MTKNIFIVTALLVFFLTISGCKPIKKAGPDYTPPEPEMPATWKQTERQPDPAVVPDETEIKVWWTVFNDPMLDRLVEETSKGNLDLRIALARVDEARARYGIAEGQQAPVIDIGSASGAQQQGGGSSKARHYVGMDASWEIDLFGRIARTIEAAQADYEASHEDRVDVMITMYAEMARAYVAVRTFQARLATMNKNISSQNEILALTKTRFEHGLTSMLDVAQAEEVLATSESRLPPLRIELTRAINTIGVLLGKHPGSLYDELNEIKPIPAPPEQMTVGVPADILRQRPDIRRTERYLAAQTARVGIAAADLYPTLTLNGSISGDLLNSKSSSFFIGPSIRWNIYDGGRIRNQIKVEDARAQQAMLRYERTVLNAINEVENALTAYYEQRILTQSLHRSVKASRRTFELGTTLYKEGLTDFQNVLDAQRALFDNENRLEEAEGKMVFNLIRLYKALGGGWDPDEIKRPSK